MLSVETARARILSLTDVLDAEQVPVRDALGRALRQGVVAARTLPVRDTSAMDGYAVRAADLAGPPVTLRLTETVFAGQRPTVAVAPGTAARIMTGAWLPEGADTVVMQEVTKRPDDATVEILEAPAAGANVRRAGEDVRAGEPLLPAGAVVGLAEAAALWAQGLDTVQVTRRPVVAIASSGDELAPVGEPPGERQVDTNSPVIALAVERSGGVARPLGLAADRLDAVTETFARGLDADVLITIAGASVGEKDFTRDAFAALGVELDFWKVAMKPGKPLAFGKKGKTLVLGLPGNPVSAMVTFELFARPVLKKLQGLEPRPQVLPGRAAAAMKKAAGLTHFVRVIAETRDGALWASPLTSQSSGSLSSVVGATHLARLPAGGTGVEAGEPVELLPVCWR